MRAKDVIAAVRKLLWSDVPGDRSAAIAFLAEYVLAAESSQVEPSR